ncbi:MAG: OmpA family protein [Candidatus Tectomicrobia bacterium]|nr:OmpA family protein [Candidatus Tectomicrobia bacterium]
MRKLHNLRRILTGLFFIFFLLGGATGCVATRDWVRTQLAPVQYQVTEVDTRLQRTTEQTDLALKNLEHLRLEQRLVLGVQEGARFAFDSERLTPTAERTLDAFVQALDKSRTLRFLVVGHTDSTGADAYNDILGQRRAAYVARYLITRRDIDPRQVTVASYGERNPIADNHTPEGRAANRRVEIQVYTEVITSTPGPQRLELERQRDG